MISLQETRKLGPGGGTARVAIIGGGISGLSAAWELERLGVAAAVPIAIDLYEASPRLGGKIDTRRVGPLILEGGAESWLSRKPIGMEFCRRLGLESRVQSTRPEHDKTYVFSQGRWHRLPQGLSGFAPTRLGPLFGSSLLSLAGKLRVVADLWIPPRRGDDDESLESFFVRRLGTEAYRRIVEPLLGGIYSGRGSELSLLSTFPELRAVEKQHGSLIRGLLASRRSAPAQSSRSAFVTLRGGMTELIDAARQGLRQTDLRLGQSVRDVRNLNGQWRIETDRQPAQTYDGVIAAVPSRVSAGWFEQDLPGLASLLREISHTSTITINLWYDRQRLGRSLDGYGLIVPPEERVTVTAVTWTSSKHWHRAPDDCILLRAFVGGAGVDWLTHASDAEIARQTQQDLRRLLGVDREATGFLVTRWCDAAPQYTLGHLDRLAAIDRALLRAPGLYLCGASYRGVGIPDCIADGELAARRCWTTSLQRVSTT